MLQKCNLFRRYGHKGFALAGPLRRLDLFYAANREQCWSNWHYFSEHICIPRYLTAHRRNINRAYYWFGRNATLNERHK